jgi:hypothetical protein
MFAVCLSRCIDRRNFPVSLSTSRGVFVFLSDLSLQRALELFISLLIIV